MFAALGRLVATYPRWVLALWFCMSVAALPFAARVGEVLTAEPVPPSTGAALSSSYQKGTRSWPSRARLPDRSTRAS